MGIGGTSDRQAPYDAGIAQAIERYWRKALVFIGRASRSEYGTMWLLGTVLIAVIVVGGYGLESMAPELSNLFGFLFFV
ncbi:hypothetical protein [Sinomonas atrocyanea]|jgi:uncharacterized membrane protein YhaH (DUF805 family)|uniref:hypothetical protein n=1 Tax=Sinomonas atrocyanea TaxID=37927 RepID=UPI002784595C|nr:hypothetical protein [Sinomonas atrocyanea]MDQ0261915.1 uncharacterized membrane protein YhaH (DUF805 family) [Sinomonas atrocyanea]MDR6623679.1 uncharacterized membrane protein YhaH (DUF805 family) [Sinomonas atrocyanea]